MASNDLGAIGAIAALCQMGLSVPRDVSVTGMDNIAAARFCQPPLTTASQTHLHLGRRAVEMVISILEERSPPEVRQQRTPQLVVRQSTGPSS
jgi:DNA-binding LacI/PurR family transcriptional regulator